MLYYIWENYKGLKNDKLCKKIVLLAIVLIAEELSINPTLELDNVSSTPPYTILRKSISQMYLFIIYCIIYQNPSGILLNVVVDPKFRDLSFQCIFVWFYFSTYVALLDEFLPISS